MTHDLLVSVVQYNADVHKLEASLLNNMEVETITKTGFDLYKEGKSKDAATFLEKASDQNHPFAQQLYADICFRQLDDQPHSLKEAAMWYLLSSHGNADSLAYVESVVPDLFEMYKSPKQQMEMIVQTWVLNISNRDTFDLKCEKADLDWKTDKKPIRTPTHILVCQKLNLKNIESTPECANALFEMQRYFMHLQDLTICLHSAFDKISAEGRRILKIFDALKARDIQISIIE